MRLVYLENTLTIPFSHLSFLPASVLRFGVFRIVSPPVCLSSACLVCLCSCLLVWSFCWFEYLVSSPVCLESVSLVSLCGCFLVLFFSSFVYFLPVVYNICLRFIYLLEYLACLFLPILFTWEFFTCFLLLALLYSIFFHLSSTFTIQMFSFPICSRVLNRVPILVFLFSFLRVTLFFASVFRILVCQFFKILLYIFSLLTIYLFTVHLLMLLFLHSTFTIFHPLSLFTFSPFPYFPVLNRVSFLAFLFSFLCHSFLRFCLPHPYNSLPVWFINYSSFYCPPVNVTLLTFHFRSPSSTHFRYSDFLLSDIFQNPESSSFLSFFLFSSLCHSLLRFLG